MERQNSVDNAVDRRIIAHDRRGLDEMKRDLHRLVDQVVNSVHRAWQFQTGSIEQARRSVQCQLVDELFKIDATVPNLLNQSKLKRLTEIPALVSHVHHQHMAPYRKWCRLTLQRRKLPTDEHRHNEIVPSPLPTLEHQSIADMLLLHAIFVEIDILRSQNNFTMLMFHACKQYFENEYRNAHEIFSGRERRKHEKRYGQVQEYASSGMFVRSQALYMHTLMGYTGFTMNSRNEHFFCWSDLNALCATIPFAHCFLKWFSFQKCFKLRKESHIHTYVTNKTAQYDLSTGSSASHAAEGQQEQKFQPFFASSRPQLRLRSHQPDDSDPTLVETPIALKPLEIQQQIRKQQKLELKNAKKRATDIRRDKQDVKSFVRRWKTFFDRGSYLSLLHNFSLPIYLQLLCFTVTMYIFVDMPNFEHVLNRPLATIIVCAPPLVLILLLALMQLTITFWISRPWRNRYHAVLPPRSRGSYRVGYQFNYVIVILTLLASCAVMRLMMFESLLKVTEQVIIQIDKQEIDPWTMISFVLSWLPLFVVYWTLAPILFTLLSATIGFILGLVTRFNRVTTWSDFARMMNSDNTMTLFQRKLLGRRNRHLEIEQVMYRFALFFNGIIDDLYDDHLCSHKQRNMLSFRLSKFHQDQRIPIPTFRKQVRALTSFVPKSERLRRTLCKWLNNLHQRGLPDVDDVEHMPRVNFITPVFNETVMYSWEELTRPTNTDTSLLGFMIEKWFREWKAFINHYSNSSHRATLVHIEHSIGGGGDIRDRHVPQGLKQSIRLWASKRFQPVARTVEGVCKMSKALKLLLQVQTLQCGYSDEKLDQIVNEKFMYLIGAQTFDQSTWTDQMDTESIDQNTMDWMFLLQCHGTYMKLAYQRQIGDHWEAILLGKRGKADDISEEQRIRMFGRFDVMGHGKPCHQAFLMQFIDGKTLCCMDSNQDASITQLTLLPNALEEFRKDQKLRILGFPEHIFTKDWSLAGYSAALVEQVFGSLIHRAWALMGMRLHYGHPDLIDARWAMFTTGLSHLSYVSEDIFTGFDTVLNNGRIGYVNYIEMGKARDVCLFTTSKFNRKTAGGAAQMALSRQVHELSTGWTLNVAEKFSFMWSVFGHYSSNLLVVMCTFAAAVVGLATVIIHFVATTGFGIDLDNKMWGSISVVVLMQLGLTLSIPGFMFLVLDSGWKNAIVEYAFKLRFVVVSVYSIMHMLQQALFFHNGLRHPAQYIPSGRGSGLSHESIGKIVIAFDNTHFLPAVWLFILGIIGACLHGVDALSLQFAYVIMIALLWLYAPLVFNRGSFPFETGLISWAKLYSIDLDYVLKFKVRHIITELSKRKKDMKRVEQHQNMLSKVEDMNKMPVDRLTDVQGIDERALMRGETRYMTHDEETLSLEEGSNHQVDIISHSEEPQQLEQRPSHIDTEEDAEAFQYRLQTSNQRGILSTLGRGILWCKILLWNTLLLFVLVGLKTASIVFTIVLLFNPFHAPGRTELEKMELRSHSTNQRIRTIRRQQQQQHHHHHRMKNSPSPVN